LRLGIVARVYERTHAYRGRRVPSFVVTVTGHGNLRRFSRLVATRFLDSRKQQTARLAAVRPGGRGGRMSVGMGPVRVAHPIDLERRQRAVTWLEVGRNAGVALRELVSPNRTKLGFRRSVIAQVARCLDSRPLSRLAHSDLYWDRIVSIEPAGQQETYDL